MRAVRARNARLFIKDDFQLCNRSITRKYRRANYRREEKNERVVEKVDVTKAYASDLRNGCRPNGHRWNDAIFTITSGSAPRLGDTLSNTIGKSTCRFSSVSRTVNVKGKENDIPFGYSGGTKGTYFTLARENRKVPRRTESPRSFISREKAEVERCVSELESSCGYRGGALWWRRRRESSNARVCVKIHPAHSSDRRRREEKREDTDKWTGR